MPWDWAAEVATAAHLYPSMGNPLDWDVWTFDRMVSAAHRIPRG